MKFLVLFSTLFLANLASASVIVKCGVKADVDNFEVTGYELELSSQDDNFEGVVGGTWEMKIGSEKSKWLKKNPKITAQTTQNEDGDTVVEVFMRGARTPTGYTGTRYVLIGLYSDQPALEKWSLGGGIIGRRKLATFQCVTGID